MIHQGQGEIEIFPGNTTQYPTDEFAATLPFQQVHQQDEHISLLEHLFHKLHKLIQK